MPDYGAQTARGADLPFTIARGELLDLGGGYTPTPGDPVTHFGAGFAKTLASNIFFSGLSVDVAAKHTGFFTAPREQRHHVTAIEVDEANREVTVVLDNGVSRVARLHLSQGAITIPLGEDGIFFEPSTVQPRPETQAECLWPDDAVGVSCPDGVDGSLLAEAVDAAFPPDAMTAAFVVTYKGQVIAERYRDGIGVGTPLESWSMGKSVTATLLGRLIKEGVYELHMPAPIPEWQVKGDPRAAIRINDILNMSSGIRFRAMQDPEYDPAFGYPDHLYVYTGGVNAFQFAAACPRQWLPGAVGRYRNCDPVLANYLIRLAVEGRGENYHAFPQRALFDKLGISSFIIETDPYGNFLTQGYEFATARDWARLGNLYLNDGVWNGERLLPEGFVQFVSTLAPGWIADKRPIYGGFFWINGGGDLPIPKDSYFMGGAGDQKTLMIPSHDLCVVRLGHYGGFPASTPATNEALALLMRAVPGTA